MRTAWVAIIVCWFIWNFGNFAAPIGQTKQPEVTLVGIWQDSPEIASGWSDSYQFFADGHFVFHYNQMDCSDRKRAYSGLWILKGNSLNLLVAEREDLVGGHVEQARGSCGTDLELVGAQLKTVQVKPQESLTLKISRIQYAAAEVYNFETGKSNTKRIPRIFIDGAQYWKLRDDPTKY